MGMGMLGAMAGLGEGMQGFAATMKENKKQEQLAAMEKVKYERSLHLEDVRNQHNRNLQKDSQTHAETMYGTQLADRRADQAEQNKFIMGERELQQKGALDLLNRRNTLYQQNREATATFNTEQRSKEWDQIVASGATEGQSKDKVEMLKLSVLHPEVYKTLASAEKLDKFPAEQYQKQYDSAKKEFATLDKNEKKKYQEMAVTLGIDPLEASSLYATRQAMIGTGQKSLVTEGQVNLSAQEKALEEKNFKKVLADRDNVEASDAEGFTDPAMKAQILAIAEENKKKNPKTPAVTEPTKAPVAQPSNIEQRVMSGASNIINNTKSALQNYKESGKGTKTSPWQY